eukprot:gene15478-biopygen4972
MKETTGFIRDSNIFPVLVRLVTVQQGSVGPAACPWPGPWRNESGIKETGLGVAKGTRVNWATLRAKLSLPPLPLTAKLATLVPLAAQRCRLAAWRQSVAAWRHGGKAWRHGGNAGGINASGGINTSGGKAWRHCGMAAKPKPWRQSRQCQQICFPADVYVPSKRTARNSVAASNPGTSFAEMPEPPWRHGGKAGGKAGGLHSCSL